MDKYFDVRRKDQTLTIEDTRKTKKNLKAARINLQIPAEHVFDEIDMDLGAGTIKIDRLAADVMETCGGMCAVFSGEDQKGYRYVIGEKDGDLRDMVKAMNQELNGRGGGKPFFVQGSVQAPRVDIERFFREHRNG